MTLGILIVVGVVVFVIVIIGVSSQKEKEANAESINKAADILRRIGYADKKAMTEDWEHLKKFERKLIICDTWEKYLMSFRYREMWRPLIF